MNRSSSKSRVQGQQVHASNGGAAMQAPLGFWIVRIVFAVLFAAAAFHFHPFMLARWAAGTGGLFLALTFIFVETRLRHASLRTLLAGTVGAIIGLLASLLATMVLASTSMPESSRSFVEVAVVLLFTYLGLAVGAGKGEMLNLQAFGGLFGSESASSQILKVLDTSVIIDGRVADIVEAQFLDGTLLIPQFVLRELQMVADSTDPLKRQRGRRGLEVLERVQKLPGVEVQIVDDDFSGIAEVDLKLIQLAKRYAAKIVTNDFNLNKIASLQGIEVLNVNQLANALKPVVLPGEAMRVFILREGKEYNQGVAYLDDGTMVVVDGARKLISRTVDIIVTSVHQTTAGKMIFGRYDERTGEPGRAAVDPREPQERSPRPVFPGAPRT
jgi:uncharacterized protein YacL